MEESKKRSLVKALEKFEEAREKIEAHMGFCRSSAEIRILEEMIKEQVPHENFSYSADQPR
jgi:hypothetical protein